MVDVRDDRKVADTGEFGCHDSARLAGVKGLAKWVAARQPAPMRNLILAFACFLAAPALAKEPPIYVTRHYDTPAGERDPDLLPQGNARAEKLAKWFRGKKLKAIYVSDFKRTRQTAGPLAAARGITLETYDPRDTPAIVARARAAKAPVLIVGHSNTVPDIVAGLGAERPAELVHENFGDLWRVSANTASHFRIEQD
ncbi:histidine phosphatase family protein [Sphingomonas koreensis]|nr:histidine phosphatase family protein [Sphingomonas koreensis]RSU65420.1 histidine phosphatase family protein [Sphingomonas koreensis]